MGMDEKPVSLLPLLKAFPQDKIIQLFSQVSEMFLLLTTWFSFYIFYVEHMYFLLFLSTVSKQLKLTVFLIMKTTFT